MVDVDAVLRPWLDDIAHAVGGLDLYDVHTHLGLNDPDGFKQRPEELLEALDSAGARGVVFPSHEPAGYPPANDAVLAAAQASSGRLVAFARVNPNTGPAAIQEATRCLDAGAVGVKLHPRAEGFTMSHPAVREIVALAHERRVPVLMHAGRGIPALGEDTVRLSDEFPDARLILAHAAISDLAWLWRVLPRHRNVYIDTAWWNPSDVCAMFALAPPGQVLWASDAPYGRPLPAAVQTLRCALQVGVGPEAVRAIAGEQLERVLAGEEPLDLGPPPGPPQRALHPLFERVLVHLTSAIARAFVRADYAEPLALARLACAVGEEDPNADVFSSILELLDLFEDNLTPPPDGRPFPPSGRFLIAAIFLARTPDVPLGKLPELPRPIRSEAEHA